MTRSALIATTLLYSLMLAAQEYPRKEVDLERLADELFGFQDLDLNYEDLYENLALLLSTPLNINKATEEELRFVNVLTEAQLQSFLTYRTEYGALLSIYELQAVPLFDLETIYRIVPFLIVEDPLKKLDAALWDRIRKDGDNYFIIRYERTLETKTGFTDAVSPGQRFLGDENRLYMRFRSSRPGDFSIGFTVEKDAGEQITWNPTQRQYGFDFISYHVQVMNKGRLKNLIVGNFQSQFAQGLLFGGKFGFGKGGETITTVRRSNLGFSPYTSLNEAGYMRGASITYEIHRNVYASGFYSNAWRDATVAGDTTEQSFVSAFQTTGLHRNLSELSRRQRVNEQQYGVVINYRKRHLDAGLTYNQLTYNFPVRRNPQPYNQYTFSGISQQNVGMFANFNLKNFTLFSEVAKTVEGGFGLTAGLMGSVTPRLDFAFHYRNYQRNFYSLYGNAFAESTLAQNERGMYWGWRYRWNRKYSLAGYTDLFRFPWLRYRSYAPSDGYEYLLRFNYQPTRSTFLFVQFREESKARNLSGTESSLYLTDDGVKRNLWLNCDYGTRVKLRFKTRAQFSSYTINGITTQGMIVLQEVTVDFGTLSLTGRYALFDTDDFDNRQYIFERDVWLAYSMPNFSGRGIRSYAMLQYNLTRKLTVWVRYAHTRFTDREKIGSGPDTIVGDSRNDVTLQMRMRF